MLKRVIGFVALGRRPRWQEFAPLDRGESVGAEPNPSLRNMQRCGFRTVVSRLNWAAPG